MKKKTTRSTLTALWTVPVVHARWRHLANQSHVASVGTTSPDEVCWKDCAQSERERETDWEEAKRSWARAKRKVTEARTDGDSFLQEAPISFHPRESFGGLWKSCWNELELIKTPSLEWLLLLLLVLFYFFFGGGRTRNWLLCVVDVKSVQRFNTQPKECI